MTQENLSELLVAALEPVLGPGLTIDRLAREPGGASRETWSFTAHPDHGAARRLILRRDPAGTPQSGLRLEGALLLAARREGVPVPEVLVVGDENAALGAGSLIMAFVEGETIPRRILRDDALAEARRHLAARCGEVLAAIHRIPPLDVPGLPAGDPVEQLRAIVDRLGQPHPAFELAFRWLGENRPPRTAQAVVHGDFRNGNLIVGPDGIRAVLDWELAHLGDPLEDLGWLCVKAWRFGSPLPVGGFGTLGQLVDAYRARQWNHRRPQRPALVGGPRDVAVGRHLHRPDPHPSVRGGPFGRAGGHRPPRLRGRVGSPRASGWSQSRVRP